MHVEDHCSPEIKWLNQFKGLVLKNLSDVNFTNDQLASRLHISNRKLYRIVKKNTGQSPHQYIRSLRLEQAYELLMSEKNILVKQVAGKVGFKKVPYFTLLFKAKFKLTPIEVLRNKAVDEN